MTSAHLPSLHLRGEGTPGTGLAGTIFVSLDLETTGLDPATHDVIEVGAVKFRGDEVLGTYFSLVDPQRPVPLHVEKLTGIRTADLARAPVFASVAENLQRFAGPHPLIGQNISFDVHFLQAKGLRLPGPFYDTFDLAAIVLPSSPDYSLATISAQLGVAHDRPHRAGHDAHMAMEVFVRCLARLATLPPHVLEEMGRIASRSAEWPVRRLLMDIAAGAATPLQAGEPGLEGLEVSLLAERLRVKTPDAAKPQPAEDGIAMQHLLGETGALASTLGAYELRAEQLRMTEAVERAFKLGGQLVAEAGTGTGKSLAYLLPAALHALHTGERVVLSTNTINLQEQITQKDIPDALQALSQAGAVRDPAEVRAAMLKGRANYLCLRKWAALKNGEALTPAEAKTLVKLLLWLQGTATGDRGELNLTPPEAAIWQRISAQAYEHDAGPCPMARRGLCFYAAARQRAEHAHLLSVNHALLALDAKIGSLLPSYDHLIIDEAHNLEDVATRQFGFEVDDAVMDAYIGTIAGGTSAGLGILPRFRLALRPPLGEVRIRELSGKVDEMEDAIQVCRQRLSTLFKLLLEALSKQQRGTRDGDNRVPVTKELRAQPAWGKVTGAWQDAFLALERLSKGLSFMEGQVPTLAEQLGARTEELRQEIVSAMEVGQGLSRNLQSALAQPDAAVVHWLSTGYHDAMVRVHSAPLKVGPVLHEQLFSRLKTLVITGATLSTEGNFEYLKERLDLKPTAELLLGSPFDYARAALMYLPQDMPDPTAPNYQAALDQAIADVARAAHGRTLVLFTSRAAMRASKEGLEGPLAKDGILVLAQGMDGSPRQLVRTFRSTPKTVLLGTGSFWEGVDIPGDALSVLVIARLPFAVPSDPVFAARSALFEDPFSLYAVPQAVVRFRQGFGRLIRRKTDRGVLVVLDRRVFSRKYGPAFLGSLPPCTQQVGPLRDLPGVTTRWLAQRGLG